MNEPKTPVPGPGRLNPRLRGLACFACGLAHDVGRWQTVCTACGLPLRVDYELGPSPKPGAAGLTTVPSMWRYREVMPLAEGEVSLGEGQTPLITVDATTWVKDEAGNPTGSFKARGLSAAVSMARHFGARSLSAPSAGNAAGALAAYGAAAGLPVFVAMPDDTPRAFVEECRFYGAQVELVRGSIADAGAWLRQNGPRDATDVSTLREPYRVEGKKTMGYELFEQFGGDLPDVVVYPTGGGTGLVGMHKAFAEMRALGWLAPDARVPRFVSVQTEGCAPVVKAFAEGAEKTEPWPAPKTDVYGLRVPSPIGGFLCVRALRESGGTGVAVPEGEVWPAARELGRRTGLDICPEGGAAWAALARLRASGWVRPGERVVVFNTGTGLKYR